jgi:hypothetical protein
MCSRLVRLFSIASDDVRVSVASAATRGSHGNPLRSQSFAATVSSSRLTKSFSVRSMMHRSPGRQPTNTKIAGRAIGVISRRCLASPNVLQVSKTSRSRWSGGIERIPHVRNAFRARSHGRSHGCRVRRHIGAWLMQAAKRPRADAVRTPA